MFRPNVSLENYSEVYDFYENHRQNQVFARFGHFALSKVFRPIISYGNGGETESAITEEINSGAHVLLSPNHLTYNDQYALISVVQRAKTLHPLRGHTFIPGKLSLFDQPVRKGGPILRRMIDEFGGVPVIRAEDLRRRGIEMTPEIDEQYRAAIIKADEIEVTKLSEPGLHMAAFWEGTRNKTDFRVVQELKKGVGHTACKVPEVTILPVGIYYGEEPEDYEHPKVPIFRPYVHIGAPFRVETSSPDELAKLVRPAIQECVDFVVEQSQAA